MRRTIPAIAAFGALALLAAACGSNTSGPSGSSSASSSAKVASFKGCMVTDTGGIDDRSFNASSWQGMQQAAAGGPEQCRGEVPAVQLAERLRAEHQRVHRAEVRDHRDRRLPDGRATQTAAKAHPSQKFAIVDFNYSPPLKNVDALLFDTVQDGFLGGYLAAGMTKTGKVATFGGIKLPTVTIYMDGFWDGVQYYNPKHHTNVKVLGWNEKTQNGQLHRRLHRPDQGPDPHQHVHPGRRGHHLPGGRERRPRRGQGGADRRPAGPQRQHDVGGHRRLRERRRSTASTSSPAWRRASRPR